MSTFFGGEVITGFVRVDATSTGTHYTVPSDKYAKVYIEIISLGPSSSWFIGNTSYGSGGPTFTGTWYQDGTTNQPNQIGNIAVIILNEGQTISTNGTCTLRANILEFSKP